MHICMYVYILYLFFKQETVLYFVTVKIYISFQGIQKKKMDYIYIYIIESEVTKMFIVEIISDSEKIINHLPE